MRSFHGGGGRDGDPLAAWISLGGRLRARRHRFSPRRRRSPVGRAANAASAANHGRARRGGNGERRDRARSLPFCHRRRQSRNLLAQRGCGKSRRNSRWRDYLGRWRRLAHASAQTLGPRSQDRGRALAAHSVCGLLAPRAARRVRRARNRRSRSLHQLERPSADQRRDEAPGRLLLGLPRLSDRRHGLPHHRPSGARARLGIHDQFDFRPRHGRCGRQRGGHRDAVHLGLSGGLSAAVARPGHSPQRSRRRRGSGSLRSRSPESAALFRSRLRSQFRSRPRTAIHFQTGT